jgi:hypothetical protein
LVVISGICVDRAVTRLGAEGGATFFCLSVQEEIAQDPAGTPKKAIGPTFDAALGLVEDEDGARCDHFPFRLHQPASNAGDDTPASGFEDEEGVARGFDPTLPWGLGPSWGSVIGLRGRIGVGHEEGGLDIAKGVIEARRKAAMEGARRMNQYTLTRQGEKGKKR